ncbi:MAG: amidoligase family protein [Planctomycetota bacterium]|jgi:hypothetical protein
MESKITDRRIGIEIEVVLPIIGSGDNADVQRLLAEVLTNQGIRSVSRGYTQRAVPNGCKLAIEHDMSLQDESKYAGLRWSKIEVKTMPMTWQEVEEVLPQAMEIVRYCGARVNHSCGLHVHHHLPEVTDKPEVVRSLQHLWWRFHHVMYGIVASSRKANTYCHPPQRADATQYDNCRTYPRLCELLSRVSRFNGLNLTNLSNAARQTVEWRLHSGTTDWEKIKVWTLATQRWVEHAVTRSCHYKPEPMANTQAGMNSLLVTTGLKGNSRIYRKVEKELREVGKYLLRRWKHLNMPPEMKARVAA